VTIDAWCKSLSFPTIFDKGKALTDSQKGAARICANTLGINLDMGGQHEEAPPTKQRIQAKPMEQIQTHMSLQNK